jgi:VWFA-related protein
MSFMSPTSPGNPVKRRRPAVAAALLLAFVAGVVAQEPPAQLPQPTFKSGVQLVEVDVRVFDRDGRFVTDLTRDDFELLEQGTPQKIDALLLVGASGPAAAAPPPDPASALPSAPGTTANPSGRQAWIFFFDLNHLTPGGGFDRARKAVEDFIRDRFREGDMAGVLAGDRMINNRLTSVREELLGAVKQVKPRGDARTRFIEMTREWPRLLNEEEALRVARGEREPLQRATTRACSDDAEQCPIADSAVRQKGQKIGAEIQRSSIATLTALNGLASGLAKMPGPKTVVFLSDGFVAQESEATLRTVVGQITRAGARVYAIDVRGLNRFGGSNFLDQAQAEDSAGPVVSSDSLADGPNSVAVDTGGLMIRNENNIGRALDTVAEDTGRYYVLAYEPANSNFDGKYREIRVRVKREGIRVRARSGYLALPASRMLLPQPVKPPEDPAETAGVPDAPELKPAAGLPDPLRETTAPLPTSPGLEPRPVAAAAPEPAAAATTGVSPAVRLRPDEASRVNALSERGTGGVSEAAKRGWEAYQRGNIEAAGEALSTAARAPDAPPWVFYALGMTQVGLGQIDDAITSWERVRAALPDFQPVYMDLADTYAGKADLTTALAIVREAEQRWPNSADVQSAIGVIHVRRGAVDDGIRALEKVTSITPEDDLAWLNLGRAYALRFHRGRRYVTSQRRWIAPEGDRAKALEALRKCAALGGPYADAAKAEMSVLEWSK